MKLYQALASSLQAELNCAKTNNNEWLYRHCERIDRMIANLMPSGSGWDNGTVIERSSSYGDKFVFRGSFHHMDQNGSYDGWTDHTIIVTPSFVNELNIRITGRNRNDIKEYLHQIFFDALMQDVTKYIERERFEAEAKRNIGRIYHEYRRKGWIAKNAYRAARVKINWHRWKTDDEAPEENLCVRLRVVADDSADFDDLCGDTFNPNVNTDIPESKLEREREQFREHVNNVGVYGVIGEYWDGKQWQHADSCYGFVGDDWKDSGYDIDIMSETLRAAGHLEHERIKIA